MDFIWIFRKSVLLVVLFLSLISCEIKSQIESSSKINKINGLSFVAAAQPYDKKELNILRTTHANDVAIMPFGFMKNLRDTAVYFDHPRQWWGERTEGCVETIRQCKNEGFQIMLKPQLWVNHGEFTGLIEMETEGDWLSFERNYSQFILHFAKIAQDEEVELFCVGTELGKFVAARPDYWDHLLQEVRSVYKGKLTYAENWDCFDRPLFLKQLDYVGVDAYFPLSDKKNPTNDEIRVGWKIHIAKLEACSKNTGKPILFTECGYRSVDYAGHKPWDFGLKNAEVNEKLQARLLEVLFELWEKDWMAGGYIWKWFPYHQQAGGKHDDQFTPQNKLAEQTIIDFFKRNKD